MVQFTTTVITAIGRDISNKMNSARANKMMMRRIIVIAIMSVTATTTAFGQQQLPRAATPPTDTELVDSEQIIQEMITELQFHSRLEDYRLYQNGTAEYTIRLLSINDLPLNKTITIITEHEYTPANGYIFDNTTGEVITPQGEKLVISTFD
jgi:hypothetical protein